MIATGIDIKQLFPKYLFWDVDMACLDLRKDRDFIIPRALIATTESTFASDIAKLESIYPQSVIAHELKITSERISNNVCRLVASRYHVKQFSRFSNEGCFRYFT